MPLNSFYPPPGRASASPRKADELIKAGPRCPSVELRARGSFEHVRPESRGTRFRGPTAAGSESQRLAQSAPCTSPRASSDREPNPPGRKTVPPAFVPENEPQRLVRSAALRDARPDRGATAVRTTARFSSSTALAPPAPLRARLIDVIAEVNGAPEAKQALARAFRATVSNLERTSHRSLEGARLRAPNSVELTNSTRDSEPAR